MRKQSGEWPELWQWSLKVENRLTKLEGKVFRETTDKGGERPTWTPRDFMAAGAGIAMVIAAISDKIGWTSLGAFLVRLYGVR
jgi:hypothetical protein